MINPVRTARIFSRVRSDHDPPGPPQIGSFDLDKVRSEWKISGWGHLQLISPTVTLLQCGQDRCRSDLDYWYVDRI